MAESESRPARISTLTVWCRYHMKCLFSTAAIVWIAFSTITSSALAQADSEELAKHPTNPVASLISLPFQFNLDRGIGPNDDEKRYAVNTERDDTTPVTVAQDSSPGLVRQIGRDFKNVFTTKDNLLIVGTGLGASWGASHFDDRIVSSGLNSELHEGARLDHFFEAGQIMGGGLMQVGGAFATYGLGELLSNPDAKGLGRDLVRAQLVTHSLTYATKFAVGRERPDASNHRSFPSGHASATFATATVLQRRYGWRIGVPAYAFASYVGTSRLNENRHYLSDVVFGAAVGILVGRTVTIDLAKARFVVNPMMTRGGYGIQLAWLGWK